MLATNLTDSQPGKIENNFLTSWGRLTWEQKEYLRCKYDPEYFIENYIYIEDRDAPELAVPFVLWPGQKETLNQFIDYRLNIVLKARQLGLTWLALGFSVHELVFFPGYAVTALSKKEDDAKELVRRLVFQLRHLPGWLIIPKKDAPKRYSGTTWDSTTLTATISHPGKEPSIFTAMSSSPDSGRSFTSNLVLLDEWAFQPWADEIWTAAYPTINRPTGGKVIGLSTAKRVTLFEDLCNKARTKENTFNLVFLPWETDPRRTQEWYEQTKKDLPHKYMQEYPATYEEAFSAGEATAFPEFSREIHVCQPFPIPSWWRRWRSNDPGYADPFAWYWYAVSPDGIVYCYREYGREPNSERVTYTEQAKAVLAASMVGTEAAGAAGTAAGSRAERGEDGEIIKEKIGFTVVGRDAWSKVGRGLSSGTGKGPSSDGKSIVDCYTEGGLGGCIEPPRDTRTDRILRKAITHEYLAPFDDELSGRRIAKVQIFSSCTKLIEALPALLVDENDNEKVALEPHVYTNPYDAFGYGLVTWHLSKSKVPETEKTDIQRDKERMAKAFRNKGLGAGRPGRRLS